MSKVVEKQLEEEYTLVVFRFKCTLKMLKIDDDDWGVIARGVLMYIDGGA